jgi:hypothetical protein
VEQGTGDRFRFREQRTEDKRQPSTTQHSSLTSD